MNRHDGDQDNLIFEDESYQIRGAVYEVYREMGCGFLEAVYQECLEKELRSRRIPFEAQKPLPIWYKGEELALKYVPDLICFNRIIVELKAMKDIYPEHKAQLLNYLKVTGLELGLLVNFGAYPSVQIIRLTIQRSKMRWGGVRTAEYAESAERGRIKDT